MKTDRVLTIHEYLSERGVVPMRMDPPAGDARHVPITVEGDVELKTETNCGRCDRWGHPCPGCLDRKTQTPNTSDNFASAEQGR